MIWQRRHALAALTPKPDGLGLVLMGCAGAVWLVQVAPPSLLPTICAPEKLALAPTPMHVVAVGHATPERGEMGPV